jgi:hypothetical protein
MTGRVVQHAGQERLDHDRAIDRLGAQHVVDLHARQLDIGDLGRVGALLAHPLAEQHVDRRAEARHDDFAALDRLGAGIGHVLARDEGDRRVLGRDLRDAGDRDQVQAAVDRLEEHRDIGTADLDRLRHQRGRDVGVERDRHELDVEAVLGEDALVLGHEGGQELGDQAVADLELRSLRERARRPRHEREQRDCGAARRPAMPLVHSILPRAAPVRCSRDADARPRRRPTPWRQPRPEALLNQLSG